MYKVVYKCGAGWVVDQRVRVASGRERERERERENDGDGNVESSSFGEIL
jgi:hypothetical protein